MHRHFYSDLQREISRTTENDVIILMGDFIPAKIFFESNSQLSESKAIGKKCEKLRA